MKILRWTIAATIVVGYGAASAADLQPHMATKAPPVIAPTTRLDRLLRRRKSRLGLLVRPIREFQRKRRQPRQLCRTAPVGEL